VFFCFAISAAGLILLAVPIGILGVLGAFPGYFIYFKGRTPGKRALGIYIAKAQTGEPIGHSEALGRWAAQYLLFGWIGGFFVIPWLLNYLWPLWDDQHQCLHDKMCSTTVFRSR
jgi:uncharacterized RDD family membrane protein YckC